MNLAAVLPMAIVMIAGPQIISAVLLATGDNARRTSVGFLAGAALAVTLAVTVAYWVAEIGQVSAGESRQGGARTLLDWIILGLLLALAVLVFRKRKDTAPPRWMGRLQAAAPGFAFRLGFVLFLLFPTDIITTATVGAYLSRHDMAWWECVPFVLLTLLLAAGPLITLLLFGRRAEQILPRARDWMNAHSWIVSEVVIAFFLISTISNLVSD